ncbi:MAG: DUF1292 domain-containing protein [Clostridiales bacterium]|nr:DUF1292 domain-containing protein [Clostridiales bacterium]
MSCNHEHHDHECCDHDHECEKINLVLEDNSEITCDVICVFSIDEDSDQEYIVLDPGEDKEILLYRFSETDDGEVSLDNIESDEEYEAVCSALDEIFAEDDELDYYEKDE